MTAHNHGYDPTCKETRLPDGKMVGECMAAPTTTPTPETDAVHAKRYKTLAGSYHAMHDKCRDLETRLTAANETIERLTAELAAMRPSPAPDAGVEALPEGCPRE